MMRKEFLNLSGFDPRHEVIPSIPMAPQAVEAEQSVLGALLMDPFAWDRIADTLKEEDFYVGNHRKIFAAIRFLEANGIPIDTLTVCDRLQALGELEAVGGLEYIGGMVQSVPTSAHVTHYAQIVKERSTLRKLSLIGAELYQAAHETKANPAHVRDAAEKALFELTFNKSADFVSVEQTVNDVLEAMEDHSQHKNPITGTPTGLVDLDHLTGGFQAGDLVILAGRPSMGKTAMALGFILHALHQTTTGAVQLYSLEMPATQIIYRLLGQLTHLPIKPMAQGMLSDDDWDKVSDAYCRLNQIAPRLALDESGTLTPTQLRAKARRAAKRFGAPMLIVVDYLQLMQSDGRAENRNLEITEISRQLKALAKEMRCPVIALSQLNRSLENRMNKRPLMADLRESGALEQDADLVALIYRDEVYHSDTQDRGIAEIIIAKHRNGSTGTLKAAFLAEEARFANLATSAY
jgi:replicative DNA helicase